MTDSPTPAPHGGAGPTPSPVRPVCPACSGATRRLRRTALQRRDRSVAGLRRYRCTAPDCAWEGLLPRPARRRRPLAATLTALRPALPLVLAGAGGMATAAVGLLMLEAVRRPGAPASAPALWLAPGDHHDGVAMATAHPFVQAPETEVPEVERLAVRQACAWGTPGRNPYRGTVEQALVTAKLPAEVVHAVAAKVREGRADGRLEIRNDGIRSTTGGRSFDADNVALTYGRTLCVNARVNFSPGHVEPATLYEVADQQGRVHSVMVPDVCGNVSVLNDRMERGLPRVAVLAADAETGPRLLRLVRTGADPGHPVPEPSSLALAGLALAAAAAARGLGRH